MILGKTIFVWNISAIYGGDIPAIVAALKGGAPALLAEGGPSFGPGIAPKSVERVDPAVVAVELIVPVTPNVPVDAVSDTVGAAPAGAFQPARRCSSTMAHA